MTKRTSNKYLWLLCMLLCSSLHAQFKNKAALALITKTGFYAIAVTPELSSYIKTDFSDLRVMDDSERQVPYIIQSKAMMVYDTTYTQLRITRNELIDSGKSIIIIENSKKQALNSIALLIRNSSVNRMVDISGSDDERNWYSIAESVTLEKKYIEDADKFLQSIGFPLSSYRFLKLTINNGKNDPLNIIAAGVYESVRFASVNPYVLNAVSRFVQTDSSDGFSYIKIHDSLPFHKTNIMLAVEGPRFYKRDAEAFLGNTGVVSFTVSSGSQYPIELPLFKSQDWLLKLYNGDNPPLKFTIISTNQEEKRIIAYLDSGIAYHLVMNDSSATAPQYDLQAFKDSIPGLVAQLKFLAVEPISTAANQTAVSTYSNKTWMWAAIIAILAGLLYFTRQLTKEVGKRQ